MELISYSADDLSSLRPNEYFYEPSSQKIYQYRNKEGKAIIVREIGTSNITKLFKNTLKTVLKVEGEFDKYQVINISDTTVTLFNINIGESFELGFGDSHEDINNLRESFNKGDEITADVFEYEDTKEIMKLTVITNKPVVATSKSETTISDAELKRVKEIEEKKAKKRPFNSSESPKITSKAPEKVPPKSVPKSAPKETKRVAEKEKLVEKKEEKTVKKEESPKDVKKNIKEEPKKETKEVTKEKEKKEKEDKKKKDDKGKKGKK
jgi:hypothetical protein